MELERPIRARAWAKLITRLVLGITFVAAGTYKITEGRLEFWAVLRAMPLLKWMPREGRLALAGLIPAYELFLGTMFVIGSQVRVIACHAAVLLLAFTAGVAVQFDSIAHGCGCFWRHHRRGPENLTLLLLRNTAFLVLAVALLFLDPPGHGGRTKPAALTSRT